jgi:hypothetical protein
MSPNAGRDWLAAATGIPDVSLTGPDRVTGVWFLVLLEGLWGEPVAPFAGARLRRAGVPAPRRPTDVGLETDGGGARNGRDIGG